MANLTREVVSPPAAGSNEPRASGNFSRVSAITLWERAKLAELDRIRTTGSVEGWLSERRRDPCDQIIVATDRVHDRLLTTADERICNWGGVRIL